MNTFILFIFGQFDDYEDIEFFCLDVITQISCIKSVRFVIENSQNIIAIFESENDFGFLSKEMYDVLTNENVKYYFMFERDNLISAHLPQEVKDFIYQPTESNLMRLEYRKIPKEDFELDELLEKIEKNGMDSLTPAEKKFLDNFEN
jgi:hypothetical protein